MYRSLCPIFLPLPPCSPRIFASSFSGSPARGYTMRLPSDRGVLVPGSYMLFALNASGVPSVARIINIR